MSSRLDKNQVGLAGEFYVLAQLSARGFVGTLTLGNTKGVDILVTNQSADKLYKVEVKTTLNKPRVEKLFSDKANYHWTMSRKHEEIAESNLIYCFVYIESVEQLPIFFLVPSQEVAEYVKWQHEYWLSTREKAVKDSDMRKFRIAIDDPNQFRDNWEIFS